MKKDGKVYVQAGGGIVADSQPDLEYEESANKAKAVMEAIDYRFESRAQEMRRNEVEHDRID